MSIYTKGRGAQLLQRLGFGEKQVERAPSDEQDEASSTSENQQPVLLGKTEIKRLQPLLYNTSAIDVYDDEASNSIFSGSQQQTQQERTTKHWLQGGDIVDRKENGGTDMVIDVNSRRNSLEESASPLSQRSIVLGKIDQNTPKHREAQDDVDDHFCNDQMATLSLDLPNSEEILQESTESDTLINLVDSDDEKSFHSITRKTISSGDISVCNEFLLKQHSRDSDQPQTTDSPVQKGWKSTNETKTIVHHGTIDTTHYQSDARRKSTQPSFLTTSTSTGSSLLFSFSSTDSISDPGTARTKISMNRSDPLPENRINAEIFSNHEKSSRDVCQQNMSEHSKSEKLVDPSYSVKDSYEWAYAVWRRKGLLGEKEQLTMMTSPMQTNPTQAFNLASNGTSPYRKSRHSLPAMLVSTKCSTEKQSFKDVMNKWRVKSDATNLPEFLSPQPKAEVPHILLNPATSTHSDTQSEIKPINKAKLESLEMSEMSTDLSYAGAKSLQSSSTNKTEAKVNSTKGDFNCTDKPSSPIRKVPHSQAWKLKWGSAVNKKAKTRQSMPATISTKKSQQRVPKSHADFKSAVQDFLKPVSTMHSAKQPHNQEENDAHSSMPLQIDPAPMEQSESHEISPPLPPSSQDSTTINNNLARHCHQQSDDSSLFSPFLPPYLCKDDSQNNFTTTTSTPRNGLDHIDDSSISAIRSKLQKECNLMLESLESSKSQQSSRFSYQQNKSKPKNFSPNKLSSKQIRSPIRVKDLVIKDNIHEIDVDPEEAKRTELGSVKKNQCDSSLLSDMISPEGRKIMKNLNSIEDVASHDETFSDRPWQHDQLISRVESLTDDQREKSLIPSRCCCSDSLFSGNDEMIDFFLPLTGTACACGKSQLGLNIPSDPTSLINILRSWQVEFLASFGIYRGEDLVKANHRSASALATALRQYRKKMGMTPFRTKSCITALQIWSKTSKAFVRSIRNQTESNMGTLELKAPNNLYILSSFLESVPSDGMISNAMPDTSCARSPLSFVANI